MPAHSLLLASSSFSAVRLAFQRLPFASTHVNHASSPSIKATTIQSRRLMLVAHPFRSLFARHYHDNPGNNQRPTTNLLHVCASVAVGTAAFIVFQPLFFMIASGSFGYGCYKLTRMYLQGRFPSVRSKSVGSSHPDPFVAGLNQVFNGQSVSDLVSKWMQSFENMPFSSTNQVYSKVVHQLKNHPVLKQQLPAHPEFLPVRKLSRVYLSNKPVHTVELEFLVTGSHSTNHSVIVNAVGLIDPVSNRVSIDWIRAGSAFVQFESSPDFIDGNSS